MKELINFLTDWGDISVGVVFVLIPFSAFVALFHHVILGGIYGWDYKPKWLLFVLEPTLVCFLGVIKPGFGLCALVLLFVLTFVLAIVGLIIMPLVRRLRKVKAEYRKPEKSFRLHCGQSNGNLYIGDYWNARYYVYYGSLVAANIFGGIYYPSSFRAENPGVTVILCVYRQYCPPLLYVLWLWGLPKWKE